MSRVARVVFGVVALGVFLSVAGCEAELSLKTKTRFIEDNVTKEDTAAWAGQPITIDIDGVGVAVNGGVSVKTDPTVTKVRATARLLAMALPEEKANADASINDANQTFSITNTPDGITVACRHGGAHGSSNSGDSGCELVELTVPAGTAQQKLALTVLSGNGTMTLRLSDAVLANLGTNTKNGLTDAVLPATPGANISLVSPEADDFKVKLPANFAADQVILQADADKIDLGPFTDIKNGEGAGGRGAPGAGLASLKITSKEFAGSTGKITLSQ